jgi:hypothetical protein
VVHWQCVAHYYQAFYRNCLQDYRDTLYINIDSGTVPSLRICRQRFYECRMDTVRRESQVLNLVILISCRTWSSVPKAYGSLKSLCMLHVFSCVSRCPVKIFFYADVNTAERGALSIASVHQGAGLWVLSAGSVLSSTPCTTAGWPWKPLYTQNIYATRKVDKLN